MSGVFLDGMLAVIVGCCGFAIADLSSDESFKYVTPAVFRYWIVFGFGFINAGCVSLMFFRNKAMSEHLNAKTPPNALSGSPQPLSGATDITPKQP